MRAVVAGLLFLTFVGGCDDSSVETVEECVDLGGRVAPNTGAGAECAEGEVDLGYIEDSPAFEPPKCCLPR
jgi:hypothetical protein